MIYTNILLINVNTIEPLKSIVYLTINNFPAIWM